LAIPWNITYRNKRSNYFICHFHKTPRSW